MKHRKHIRRLGILPAIYMMLCPFGIVPQISASADSVLHGRLIRDLTVNDTEHYQSWSISENLSLDDKLYGDRDVTYAGIPRALVGAETVQTACDGKAWANDQATLTLAADAGVFVALDSRVTNKPAFLADFVNTGATILNSNDVVYNVYCKRCRAGESVTLGFKLENTTANWVAFDNFRLTYLGASLLLGDVDNDGELTAADVVAIARILTGHTAAPDGTPYNLEAADVNGVNGITIADITALVNILP